jgi:hypothetical protein
MQFHRVNLRLISFFSSVKMYPLPFSFPKYQFGLLLIGWSRRFWMKKLQHGVHDIHEQGAHHIITLPLKVLWDSIDLWVHEAQNIISRTSHAWV